LRGKLVLSVEGLREGTVVDEDSCVVVAWNERRYGGLGWKCGFLVLVVTITKGKREIGVSGNWVRRPMFFFFFFCVWGWLNNGWEREVGDEEWAVIKKRE
jgi:hypothetical protein